MTLDVVQDAALASASAQADAIRRAAEKRAEEIVASARRQAAEMIASGRAAAERLADLEQREQLAQARSSARAIVLRAQRSVLLGAASATHAALGRIVEDPRYLQLLERLETEARDRLAGPRPVEIQAAPEGGFVAVAGSRRIDYSLRAQTNRRLAALAGQIDRLWR